ncbi:hypothetical protein N8I77_006021 [Diaporthe amygdali]|uniref:Uncharacterized protein n=1 Tax=Phomopsis amygdali TaxID=1214568 RepID=A0AAD9W3J9_PHOAM|nr:hypothetical protein N8I77_006021 [Diaporthe amygdali]
MHSRREPMSCTAMASPSIFAAFELLTYGNAAGHGPTRLLFLVTDGYLSKHHPNHPTVVSAGFAIHHTWTLMILECMHRPAYRSLLILGLILEVDGKAITVHIGDSVASEGALAPLWEIEMTI